MKKLLFLLLLVTLSSMTVQAIDTGNGGISSRAMGYFSMPEIQVEPGETFVLPVSFTCENSLYSLAFAVSIPEGFEVLSVEKTDRVIGTFGSGNPAGVVNVAIYNLTGQSTMSGNDGAIVNITLKAADDISGDYIFTISGGNYGVVGIYNDVQYPGEVSTTVHVNPAAYIGELGYFSMPEIQVEPGETFVLPVSFTCENSIFSLGFAVSIPEGFEVLSVEKTDRVIGTFGSGNPAGVVNVAIYNLSGQSAISGNDGAIVNITLKAADNLNGDYTFNISSGNYGIVGIHNNIMYPEDVSTTVHVNPAAYIGELGYFSMPEIQVEPGETFVLPVSFTCENSLYSLAFAVSIPEGFEVVAVEKTDRVTGTFQYGNPAGVVNVAIYNLSGQSAMNGNDGAIVNITLKASDNLNGDYTFNISGGNYGIVGILNNVMYPEEVATTVHVSPAPYIGELGYFSMPEIEVEPGETFVLPVSFTCENSLYSLAFAVSIPEGFEVVAVEKTDRVTGTFQYGNPAGVVNVAIYNLTG